MDRRYVLILIGISFLITNAVAFLDEGIQSFDYLISPGDWIALGIYTFLFLILPVSIYVLSKRSKQSNFYLSLFGFIPPVLLIILQLGSY